VTPVRNNEIDPRAASAFMASIAARQRVTSDQSRQLAGALIRCMDSRDVNGADAVLARLRGRDLDAVTAWVWRIEADRAARRRVYQASAAWQSDHAEEWWWPVLGEVIGVLAEAVGRPHGTGAAQRCLWRHGELPCLACLASDGDGERTREAAPAEAPHAA
jgi:hypothetical protein